MNYAALEGSTLKINLYDLIRDMQDEDRAQIIDALSCTEELINEVVNQVLDGWTSMGSHAGKGFGGDPDATRGIDGARMRIAKASSEVAAEEIESLKRQIIRERELGDKGWAAYHATFRDGRQ